jgi:hypothetical protein
MRRPLSTTYPRHSAQQPRLWRRVLIGRRSWAGVLARCLGILVALGLVLAPTNAFSTSAGEFTIAPGQSRTIEVADRARDAYGSVKFVVPEQRTVWMALQFRAVSSSLGYRTRVRVLPNGDVWAGFSRVTDGKEDLLVSEPTSLSVEAGQTVVIEGKVVGTDPVELSVRVRVEGVPQKAWQRVAEDDSADRLTAPGKTRTWAYLSQAASDKARVSFSAASVTISDVPEPKPEPTPSTEPSPTAKPTSSASSTPSAKPTPSEKPTPTPTTATPSAKPTPSPEPTRTETPEPTPSPTPTPSPRPNPGGKPSAATTGVPQGIALKQHNGDITVTKDGTVLRGMDIHGFVNVKAANVKILDSVVRGGVAKGYATGLITNYGYPNLLIEDVSVVADHPSVYFDGIKGNNFTARRVHVVGNVDSIKIHGDNVRVEDSLLEDTKYYASDPYQGGGATHNDNIQILSGKNLTITGNTIRGASNFAILGSASQSSLPDLEVRGNWLDGGHCTVKLQVLNGHSQTATVADNKFGPNRKIKSCAFTAFPAVNLTARGNVYEADGSPVNILRTNS